MMFNPKKEVTGTKNRSNKKNSIFPYFEMLMVEEGRLNNLQHDASKQNEIV